jgi:hypothetical protein
LRARAFHFEIQFHSWLLISAAFIVVTVLAFNFLGDALRDAVDPYTVAGVKLEWLSFPLVRAIFHCSTFNLNT